MSLEQLLQSQPAAEKVENKPVSPTLMIGIGGTGKEILLRFRRQVVERYGSLSALPFIRFIHMDTDSTSNAKEQYDKPSSGDPLFDDVQFRPSERIDLSIDGGTGKYVSNIRAYPHIQRWFPSTGKIADLGNLGEGAGQVRVASRLAFYHAPNFQNITASLDHARRNLSDPRIANEVGNMGFDFDPNRLDIFVVCSIAGGTGGGTFLDMGFLLQRYFDNATTVGILVLPSFFQGYAGKTRMQANGYAALMETNHYAFGHSFLANWDGQRTEALPPPPFDVTYLIDGTNEANYGIPSNGGEYDAYQMISEVLFQDYSLGSFAGKKRATRINLVNFMMEVYSHNFLNDALRNQSAERRRNVVGDTYPTRFGSLGFSSIYFPTDRVHSACGARLAMEILDHWSSQLLQDPLEHLFTRFLSHSDVQFAQGRFDRRDGGGVVDRDDIEEALSVYEEGGGTTFASYLWNRASKLRQHIEVAPVGQKSAVLRNERDDLDRFLSFEDSQDSDEWGVGVRQLESNKRRYIDRVKEGIRKRARETANDPKHGVAYTLSLLRELKSLVRNQNFRYLHHFESEITEWRDEIQDHSFALDQLAIDMTRHEGQRLFRSHHLSWDLDRLVGVGDDDPPGAFYSYYYARLMKQVVKRGKEVCEEIDRFLGKDDVTGEGLLAEYWRLLSGFGELQRRLKNKQQYFRQERSSQLAVSLYKEEDCDTWYRTWAGEGERHQETLESLGNQLLQKVFGVETVTEAMERIQKTPADKLEREVLAQCKGFFSGQERQPEALELLFSERWEGQREDMVKRAYSQAKVWLQRSSSGLNHINLRPVVADQRPCLIGVDVDSTHRFPEFQRIIRDIRSPADSDPSFHSLGQVNRGTILFYNELAGVPAFYPAAITRPGGLQSAYLGWPEKNDLHFDKNRFQFNDLVPKTEEEARHYAESVRAFVLARVLGLLKVRTDRNEDTDEVSNYFSYARGGVLDAEDINLGSENEAIDALYRDSRESHHTDRSHLLKGVSNTFQEIRQQGYLWAYWLLLDFYIYLVYPPNRDEKWVSNLTVVKYSPEHAVLAGERDRIRKLIPSDEERRKLENALKARRREKQAEEMTHEEYVTALQGFSVPAGVFDTQAESFTPEQRVYEQALAFDLTKIHGQKKTYPAPKVAKPERSSDAPTRPCPHCQQPVDVRAAVCRHCQQPVAEIEECPVCLSKVPTDYESCWHCGHRMRAGEKIECAKCHGWSGYEDEYPCPQCGHDPITEAEFTEPQVSEASASATLPTPPQPASISDPEPAADVEPDPNLAETGSENLVECPTCYSMVRPGLKCPLCDGQL